MIKLSAQAKLGWHEVGRGLPVLVIDDALEDPHSLRAMAWKTRFHLPAPSEYYPGWQASAQMPGETRLIQTIGKLFLDRLWPQGWPAPLTIEEMVPHSTFAVFGMDRDRARQTGYIDQHVDSYSWIAVVTYLFDTPHPPGGQRGTAFWKHKPTDLDAFFFGDLLQASQVERLFGLNFIDPIRRAAMRVQAASMDALQKTIFESNGSTRHLFSLEEDAKWMLLRFFEGKFNRMIAYPTWQFHSIVDTAEPEALSIRNARLTYNTFVPYPVPAALGPQPKYTGGGYRAVEGMLIA